jgi:hypothetical protein
MEFYTVSEVKTQIPTIREKIAVARKKLRHVESKELAEDVRILVARRRHIMKNLPTELRWLEELHGEDIVGFECDLFKPSTKLIDVSPFSFKGKCKCQAVTKKGTQCTRNATDGTFCKMHS